MTELIISGGPDSEEPEDRGDTGPDVELRQLVFGSVQHGQRLDRALVELVPEFSRSYLQQLIDLGGVTINGIVIHKPSTRVKAADVGTIELRPTPQSQAFKPETMALNVVFEDEHLMVINKPAGLVVHPAPGNWSGTLLNGLLARDAKAMNLPRAGIVHRLDKDTSGLMVVARTRPVMDALIRSIAAREVSRQYVALAHGPWTGNRRVEINAPIGRDPRNRLRMAVVDLARNPGKLARTDVELLQNCDQGCWVLCTLHTGRTHQIRVHMAMIGHPLVADVLYGGRAEAGMQRQALHACRLAFTHPVTLESMVFQASLPVDLNLALANWGLSYNQT
ncbi:ribosomal large subunit pseudouridine synthase D [Rhodoferax ferrireducens T118]|uniref:Pseudouridine synthase n=1 Tax=Albidiferax ferrireducens (strain ATCC BAA-621 / DSM 15236 / T118) TaxID=338969 RepID=Q21W21_ALBFT|nr:RluA family pseudouridine synthase [Rhodoferax ferrireducens]ABD70032.1 ribosomal large subunit pseudouridine synthase D [Rhodoferax ferrireducens T118]WPC65195.1 RluA family pseudouridine synthase [Rhodoferax ferrireducens]